MGGGKAPSPPKIPVPEPIEEDLELTPAEIEEQKSNAAKRKKAAMAAQGRGNMVFAGDLGGTPAPVKQKTLLGQ